MQDGGESRYHQKLDTIKLDTITCAHAQKEILLKIWQVTANQNLN